MIYIIFQGHVDILDRISQNKKTILEDEYAVKAVQEKKRRQSQLDGLSKQLTAKDIKIEELQKTVSREEQKRAANQDIKHSVQKDFERLTADNESKHSSFALYVLVL